MDTLTHEQFLQQYVLNRARCHLEAGPLALDPRDESKDADKAWHEIKYLTCIDSRNPQ